MIEEYCRHHYQKLLVNPLASCLSNQINPNQITWLSGLFGMLVLPALFFHQVLLAVALLLLSGYCDTLDGTLARFHHKTSDWGSALDITIDRLVEWVVVFALWSLAPSERGFWCLLMLGSMLLCITSFLVVGIFSANHSQKSFHYSPGLMERAEAFFFFILMMLWPDAFGFLSCLFTVLVTLTAIIRLVQFRNQYSEPYPNPTDEHRATPLKQDEPT
ncbi:TPA: CDP-alcohol phosphatidyltransferase family protein [Legionella pneumophila]|nr:CDP-alcohol phosphatidyltransferase family protein [Legionella pneumophila]HAT8860309.1 CDP-alcohol phosphatidyltransferase family protein [Legionella pneumophila subsp. pneumophila]HAT8643085.1 CDP-alcohol phosphatidyltransferase family protein [Legionella pneumophila]HAT8868062.1 CDP-alcohol phosphatidyltransferase family protein [Legionella pneumophila subsp. pneumophila]HAU0163549.1 CDP-alcohol phosphatidyltransferase family protein [Legionella pneumophila]HCJ1103058.1 CDP-alcohol phosp